MVLRPAQLWVIHESLLSKAVDIIDLGSSRMPVEGWAIAHDRGCGIRDDDSERKAAEIR